MRAEPTTQGTWICTGRVGGRLLVSEAATRREATDGWIELLCDVVERAFRGGARQVTLCNLAQTNKGERP